MFKCGHRKFLEKFVEFNGAFRTFLTFWTWYESARTAVARFLAPYCAMHSSFLIGGQKIVIGVFPNTDVYTIAVKLVVPHHVFLGRSTNETSGAVQITHTLTLQNPFPYMCKFVIALVYKTL